MLSQHRIARMKPLTNYNITNYLTNMKYRKNLLFESRCHFFFFDDAKLGTFFDVYCQFCYGTC